MLMNHATTSRGYSLVEILVAIGIFGILAATALPHIDTRRQNINYATKALVANIRLARAKAMATGIHYCMHRNSSTKYYVRRWSDNKNIVDATLPTKVTWDITDYPDLQHVMFNSRGMLIDNSAQKMVLTSPVNVYVADTYGLSHKIVVWPSGQVYEEY
jgi:prepilin-type N-terminal cleavage/methylation domain-containing protein